MYGIMHKINQLTFNIVTYMSIIHFEKKSSLIQSKSRAIDYIRCVNIRCVNHTNNNG